MHIDDELLQTVDTLYRPTINNLSVTHPKLLILFSGPPSSGKSTVAKALEHKFQALRLEGDTIRTIAADKFPTSDLAWKSELSYRYMDYLRPILVEASPNGLWIFDANIDVYHKKIFDFAEEYGFSVIVLAIKIPEKLRKQYIIETGDRAWASQDRYLETMQQRKQENEAFLARYTPDYWVKPGYNIEDIYTFILARLETLDNTQ